MSTSRPVLNELLSSELRYLASLTYLVTDLISRIEARVNSRHLHDLTPFFSLLRNLHSFHASFHSDLSHRPPLGPLFTKALPSLRLYLHYAHAYPRALIAIHTATSNSRKFRAALAPPTPSLPTRLSGGLLGGGGGGGGGTPIPSSSTPSPPSSYDLFVLLEHVLHRPAQYSTYLHELQRLLPHAAATGEGEGLKAAVQAVEEIAGQVHKAGGGAKGAGLGNGSVAPLDPSTSTSRPSPASPAGEGSVDILPALLRTVTNPSPVLPHPPAAPALPPRRQSLPPSTAGMAAFHSPAPHPPLSLSVLSPTSPPSALSPARVSPTSPPHTPPPPPPPPHSPVPASSLSPSSTSSLPTNPIFRYVPRVLLQRFLSIDAVLRSSTSASSPTHPSHSHAPPHPHPHSRSSPSPSLPSHPRTSAPSQPPTLSSYLPSSTSPESHHYPAATILVADVSGFTRLNETFSVMEKGAGAEQVTTHLNRYFSALLNIIGSHGGDCVKFAGDALIVLFLPARQWVTDGGGGEGGGVEERVGVGPPQLHHALSVSGNALSGHGWAGCPGEEGGTVAAGRELSHSLQRLTEDGPAEAATGRTSASHFRFPIHAASTSALLDGLHHHPLHHHPRTSKQLGRDEQAETCMRAVQCALQLQQDVGVYHGKMVEKETSDTSPASPSSTPTPTPDTGSDHRRSKSELTRGTVELSLHIAIGCGSVFGFHVGGWSNEYEFVLTGGAFGQLKDGLDLSKRGEVVVSKAVWELIAGRCVGQVCSGKAGKVVKTGEVKVTAVSAPLPPHPLPALNLPSLSSHPFIPLALRSYVPRSVLEQLDAHASEGGWLSEIRTTTVIFCNLKGLTLSKVADAGDPTLTHRTCEEMQKVIGRNQGYRRQFLVDDKGTTLIVVFGVPPFAHEDDAYRGVKCALEMRDVLLSMNVGHGMGITTGVVYSGSVGSDTRQEHAVVGDTVNAAARIAAKAEQTAGNTASASCVYLDSVTYEKTRSHFEMRVEGEISVKGKETKIKIYTALRMDRLAVMETVKTAGWTLNRGAEMAAFMESLVALQKGEGQSKVIFIEGEAGIGKTHLIRNFYRVVSTNLHTLHVVYAKGDATESSSILSMWTPVMEQMMSLPPPAKRGAMVKKRTEAVLRFLRLVMPSGPTNDPRVPLLNLVLTEPVTLPDNALTKEPKHRVKQAENFIFYLLANAVAYQKKQGKHTVLFAEDVHLMDHSSLEVLRRVASIKPLLVVISARPPPNRGGVGVGMGMAMTAAPPVPIRPAATSSTTATGEDKLGSGFNTPEVSVTSSGDESDRGAAADGGWTDEKTGDGGDSAEPSHWVEEETKTVAAIVPSEAAAAPPIVGHRSVPSSISSPSVTSPHTLSSTSSSSSSSTSSSFPSTGGEYESSRGWAAHYPQFLALPNLSHIALSGLNQPTCTHLVCQRLHANTLDPTLASLIFKRSRGNPLYAVEVASHLQENGFLLTRQQDGHCLINPHLKDREGRPMSIDLASMDLPTSLKGLVLRRLDSLEKKDLLVCKLASAFGSEGVERDTLVELCRGEGVDEAQVMQSITALQAANILAVKPKPAADAAAAGGADAAGDAAGVTLLFCHELVHSACYDLLVMSQKLKLHVRLAQLELKRARRAAAAATGQDAGSGATSPAEEAEPTAPSADTAESGGGFAKRLAATFLRKRADLTPDADSTDSPAPPTTLPTQPAALPTLTPSELKRRASTLTYHYTMAIKAYTPHASGDSTDTRQFIKDAKAFLAQRLIHVPEGEEGAAGGDGDHRSVSSSGARSASGSLSMTHEEAVAAVQGVMGTSAAHAGGDAGGGAAAARRPAPAPSAQRSSWSGKVRPAPPAAVAAVPASTPITQRSLSQVVGTTTKSPPPLPSSVANASPPPLVHAVSTPAFPRGPDSPARAGQADPHPSSAVSPRPHPPHTSPPPHSRFSASPPPPPLPPPPPPPPAGEAVHVPIPHLYATLTHLGLQPDLRERIVQALIHATKAHAAAAAAAEAAASFPLRTATRQPPPPPTRPPPLPTPTSPPPTPGTAHTTSSTPPSRPPPLPLTHVGLPRSHSDLSTNGAEGEESASAEVSTTSMSAASSRSSRHAEFVLHRLDDGSSSTPPHSPLSPHQPRVFHHQPPSPRSGDSQRSSSLSLSLSRSQSFTRSLLLSPTALDHPPSPPLALAIDSLVKLHREDVLSLRSLSKQTRDPPLPVRRVLEAVVVVVNAMSTRLPSPARGGTGGVGGGKGGGKGNVGWRELLASSSFISSLVKASPLASGAAPPQSDDTAAALRAAVADPMLAKAAYVRSLSPAVRVLWAWVLAVCRELGIDRGSDDTVPPIPFNTSADAPQRETDGGASVPSTEEGDVFLVGRAAVRTRGRSRSQELDAPVSPHPEVEGPHSPASPSTLQVGGGRGGGGGQRRTSASTSPAGGRSPMVVATGQRRSVGGSALLSPEGEGWSGGQTPSPHSAQAGGGAGGGGGGGRSRAKRDALPSASSRSAQNVHLSVRTAAALRRKSHSGTHSGPD